MLASIIHGFIYAIVCSILVVPVVIGLRYIIKLGPRWSIVALSCVLGITTVVVSIVIIPRIPFLLFQYFGIPFLDSEFYRNVLYRFPELGFAAILVAAVSFYILLHISLSRLRISTQYAKRIGLIGGCVWVFIHLLMVFLVGNISYPATVSIATVANWMNIIFTTAIFINYPVVTLFVSSKIIRPSERQVLEYLHRHNYKVSLTLAATELGCDKHILSRVISNLEKKGFLKTGSS